MYCCDHLEIELCNFLIFHSFILFSKAKKGRREKKREGRKVKEKVPQRKKMKKI